jgi:hypothetical protein
MHIRELIGTIIAGKEFRSQTFRDDGGSDHTQFSFFKAHQSWPLLLYYLLYLCSLGRVVESSPVPGKENVIITVMHCHTALGATKRIARTSPRPGRGDSEYIHTISLQVQTEATKYNKGHMLHHL